VSIISVKISFLGELEERRNKQKGFSQSTRIDEETYKNHNGGYLVGNRRFFKWGHIRVEIKSLHDSCGA